MKSSIVEMSASNVGQTDKQTDKQMKRWMYRLQHCLMPPHPIIGWTLTAGIAIIGIVLVIMLLRNFSFIKAVSQALH